VSGEVVSVDGKKAVLSVGGKKMTVDVRDLSSQIAVRSSQKAKPRTANRELRTSSDAVEISAELNLIGQRVDDALEESDKFLDRALVEGKQAVRIIHGFGTGALRKAIREHLRKHPAVKSWRPGNENEGGDGATVAVLEG
jgi:DNA mismatch repair protein MutS2